MDSKQDIFQFSEGEEEESKSIREKGDKNRKKKEKKERLRDRSRERHKSHNREEDNQSEQREESQQQQQEEEQDQNDNQLEYQEENQNKAEHIATSIRSNIIDYFGKVNQEKGFVFTSQERVKLNKEQLRLQTRNPSHIKLQWNKECEWSKKQQKEVISRLFESQQLRIDNQLVKFLEEIFLNSSYIFGDETTGQLYRILMVIVKIVLKRSLSYEQDLADLMRKILDQEGQYKFFGFHFSSYYKLPENANVHEIYFNLLMNLHVIFKKAIFSHRI